jgi:hypothetical protein
MFNREGGCLAAKLRPRNVHSAEGWEELPLPQIERQQRMGKEVAFRAVVGFARPEAYEALEEEGVNCATHIPAWTKLAQQLWETGKSSRTTSPDGRA